MGTEVKFFTSTMVGAPVLSGTAGALIAVLDAVLVNGFGNVSVTGLSVAANIATATYSAGHSHTVDSVALFNGATPAGLNGNQRILSIGANFVTFATTGIADGAATGTITSKVAPLGWLKSFSGTNLAVYKSADPASTGLFLRVDDTGTTNGRVVGYETMSDVSTGAAPFPSVAQQSGGFYWAKSYQANATARGWSIFGDSRGCYLCTNPGTITAQSTIAFFGDINSNKSGDAYGCVLHGNSADRAAQTTVVGECLGYSSKGGSQGVVARGSNTLGGSQLALHVGALNISNADSYSGYAAYSLLSYPNNADNGLLFCKVLEIVNSGLRGTLPGLYHVPQAGAQDAFSPMDTVVATGDLAGRKMLALRTGAPGSNSAGNYGAVFFDLTGPWR